MLNAKKRNYSVEVMHIVVIEDIIRKTIIDVSLKITIILRLIIFTNVTLIMKWNRESTNFAPSFFYTYLPYTSSVSKYNQILFFRFI